MPALPNQPPFDIYFVTTKAAVATGTVDTTTPGLYGVGGTLDGAQLVLTVNGTPITLTLSGASSSASQVAFLTALRTAFPALTASTNSSNYLVLTTNNTGSAASIVVGYGTANTALGFTPFSYYGTDLNLLTYSGVTTAGNGSQFNTDPGTGDLIISSEVSGYTLDAAVFIDVSVPESWTMEVNVLETLLPPSFSNLVDSHFFIGSSDPDGNCAGLFISNVGLIYTGSVHLDGSGNLVIDTPMQPLPDSQLLVEEGEYWTFRIATDYVRGTTYIYVTLTSQIPVTGHQLRYVLPAITSASAATSPANQSMLSVRGTVTSGTVVQIDTIGLGTGLVIPNLPPVADPGPDQAVSTCEVVLLDGSASFDPAGGNITYQWRLLDAPLGSMYIFDGLDGITYPLSPPTGFTNLFHSQSLGVLNAQTPITIPSVLIVAGDPYNVISTGTDGNGFYVEIDGYDLPDSLPAFTAFKLLPQNGISNGNEVQATFYPDIAGIYKFDLTVDDGDLYSLPNECIVNVTESPVPRGCIPDLSFLWGYLSDFWRLLEDPERITTFWSALAQVAAAELLNLWQIEYSKSLRDIQRTWQRKWLRYALSMIEDPNYVALSTVSTLYGGVATSVIPTAGSNVSATWVDITIPQQNTNGTTYRITFYGGALLTASSIANQLAGQLQAVNTNFAVQIVNNQASTGSYIRIDAPFYFTIASTTTCPLFTVGAQNVVPQGTAGALTSTNSYKVDASLQGTPIVAGDFLVLDSVAYRIVSVITDPSDAYPLQRVTTQDPLPIGVPATWFISGQATSQTLNFYTGLVTQGDIVTFEVVQNSNSAVTFVTGTALGTSSVVTGTLGVDTSQIGFYVSQPSLYTVYFYSLIRRQYIPIDSLVVDVPYLQEIINNTDDTQVLRRNVDYFITTYNGNNAIRFVVGTNDVWQGGTPPDHMYAEMTYLDNRPTIEANFGIPADFTLADLSQLPSNVDYLSSVQGLWYAYLYGSTVFNLRVGTQILLGLPFAEAAGTITEIRDDFSTTTGRILVQDSSNTAIVRSYTYPASLSLEINPETNEVYAVGDTVAQFAPLVTGVEVLDYINSPTWYGGYVEQGSFYEVDKFFTFLVRADAAAFTVNALLFVQNFVGRIKPTYTSPLFVVEEDLGTTGDTAVSVSDLIVPSGTLNLYAGPCFHGPAHYSSGMFDQPNQAQGGWYNQWDYDGVHTPTFPNPTEPVPWAYDKEGNCPEYFAAAVLTASFAGGPFAYDSVFVFDEPFCTEHFAEFGGRTIGGIPGSGLTGYSLGQWTATATGTADFLYLEVNGSNNGQPTFYLDIYQNGSLVDTVTFSGSNAIPISMSITTGDLLELKVRSTSVNSVSVGWHDVLAILANGTEWMWDDSIPAGTYESYRSI